MHIEKYKNLGYTVSEEYFEDGILTEFEKTYIGVSEKEAIKLFKQDAKKIGLIYISKEKLFN